MVFNCLLSELDWKILKNGCSLMKKGGKRYYIYTIIPAYKAKNYDGSPSGWVEGTPDGDRLVLEEIIYDQSQLRIRYVNHWNWLSCDSAKR